MDNKFIKFLVYCIGSLFLVYLVVSLCTGKFDPSNWSKTTLSIMQGTLPFLVIFLGLWVFLIEDNI